jgi:NADH-quinone oxidoreductase subunit M
MPDLNGREWAAVLPLLLLMIWMGTYTQTFMPPISAQNTRILEQSRQRVAQAGRLQPAVREVANAR